MRAVSSAARTIAWTSDDDLDVGRGAALAVARCGPPHGGGRRGATTAAGRPGSCSATARCTSPTAPTSPTDAVLPLRAAAAAAAAGDDASTARSLDRLAARRRRCPTRGRAEARERCSCELLLAGPPAIRVIEALDQRGLWVRVLPEWEPTRSQAAAQRLPPLHRRPAPRRGRRRRRAARRPRRRPDLLVVGTLLHDIGKGYPGDHTEVGIDLVRDDRPAHGLRRRPTSTCSWPWCEHHLLLPDVATRRDLDDPATIELVAKAVGDEATLELLAALTEADSLATGPAAWGAWKAGLVADLVDRTAHVLGGGDVAEVPARRLPDRPSTSRSWPAGEQVLDGDDDTLTVVTADRPGVFSKVAGVLALHGLDVLERRRGTVATTASPWPGSGSSRASGRSSRGTGCVADLERGLRRPARARRPASTSGPAPTPAGAPPPAAPVRTAVSVDNQASAVATVIEVQAPDAVGLLYRITRALAELDLDIRSAKVQTLGPQVVDAFYVRGRDGRQAHRRRPARRGRAGHPPRRDVQSG